MHHQGPYPAARRRVGFVVDHPKRDLPGAAMLAHALARRGIETALIPLYDQAMDVPLLGLDALVVNFARPANIDLVRGYVDAGLSVWVLDTEGGVLADDGANTPAHLAAYIRDSGWKDLLAGYFFWGGTLHRAFVDSSGMPADCLHLTGCPRFDWAAPRWRELLQHERRDYILVNANFPLVNPKFSRSPDEEVNAVVAAGWDRSYVEKMLIDSRLIFGNYLATVERLARALPDRVILVRPHPFENAQRYNDVLGDLPNVVVDGRGSVLNAIKNAACVLHLNCGTAIEAVMLDRLPLSMEFLNTDFMSRHSSLPSRISFNVPTEDALIATLSDIDGAVRAFEFNKRYEDLIAPWFHNNDGDAAERIAAVLDQAIVGRPSVAVSLRRSLASSRRHSRWVQRLQAGLANALGSRTAARLRASLQASRRGKQFEVADVADLVRRLGQHTGAPTPTVDHIRHPYTGAPLSTIAIRPRASRTP